MAIKQEVAVQVRVNGRQVTATVAPEASLLDFLRGQAGAIDVKCGCNKGDCGSCTVILAGQAVKSCLVLAAQADNKEVWTLKGLAEDALMQQLQASFVTHGAVQCGFCTPGMLIAAKKCLEQHPHPDRLAVREALAGNLCRCTGYQKIVDAVMAVAADRAV